MRSRDTYNTIVLYIMGMAVCSILFVLHPTVTSATTTGLGLDWLPQLTDHVLRVQYGNGPDAGKMEPYVKQLMTVRTALLDGKGAEVYKGMNQFMDMLETTNNGISKSTADKLFDYAFEVTPAKFIEKKRYLAYYNKTTAPYIDNFLENVGGGAAAAAQLEP
ncbi:MAG: hypothetical protein NW703_05095 [Nitrospiraceae bacterium]